MTICAEPDHVSGLAHARALARSPFKFDTSSLTSGIARMIKDKRMCDVRDFEAQYIEILTFKENSFSVLKL